QVTDTLVKLRGENAVPVVQEKTVAMVSRNGFTQLLECPGGRGMRGHIHVEDTARGMFHQHKHVEETKGRRDHDAEVAGDDHLRIVTHKGAPALGRRTFAVTVVYAFRHVLPDGAG